jgi:hypothetical protein
MNIVQIVFQLTPPPINWWEEWCKSLLVALPVVVVTLIIWQINVNTRTKREKINIIATLPPLLAKQSNYFRNIERLEIQSRLAGVIVITTNNEKERDYWKEQLSILRASLDRLQTKWLDCGAKAAVLYNKLTAYINKEDKLKLHKMLTDLGDINRRQFVEEFKNIDLNKALLLSKELTEKIEKEDLESGVGKRVKDISELLQKILRHNKNNYFNYKYCCCCCYWDVIEWLFI